MADPSLARNSCRIEQRCASGHVNGGPVKTAPKIRVGLHFASSCCGTCIVARISRSVLVEGTARFIYGGNSVHMSRHLERDLDR